MPLKVTMTKVLGKIPLLYRFCEQMKLPETIDEICPERTQGDDLLSIGQIVTVLVINRLVGPTPLYKVSEWVENTGLAYLLGCDANYFNDDRLARTLDRLYNHWSSILEKIVLTCIELYSIDPSLIHYDITSLYFEGRYENSDFIAYGYSRDQKPDKKQVNLAMNMLDKEPFPLAWKIHSGNTNDTETVIDNMNRLKSLLKTKSFIFIGDKAMISEEIVKFSQEHKIPVIAPLKDMNSTKALLSTIKKENLTESIKDKKNEHETYRLGEYKIHYTGEITSPELRAIVVWSKNKQESARKKREKKINERVVALENLREKLNKPYYRKKTTIEKKLLALARNSSINELFTVNLSGDDSSLALEWSIDENAKNELELTEGFYIIGTTLSEAEMNTIDVFKSYKRQYLVENSFADLKSEIGIRPIFLHIEHRIEGLVHVTVLALCVYTLLGILLKRKNYDISPKRMFELFIGFVLLQIVLPDKTIEFQVGPLQFHEQQIIETLNLEDTSSWILNQVSKRYSLRNKTKI